MNVLLAVDDSTYSAEAARAVADRPWPSGTKIRVLSAVEKVRMPAMPEVMLAAGGDLDRLQQQRTSQAQQLIKQVSEKLDAAGLKTETAVRDGDPRSLIVKEAEEWPADLIVLGSHGYTGIKRWLLGSVAQSIVSHAPCSVEIVRSRDVKEA